MKVLVTGATGFIGNSVINELIKSNVEVIATSRDRKKAETFSWFDQINFIEFDINNTSGNGKNLFQHFNSPDRVIHLAWENVYNCNDQSHYEKNLFPNYLFLKNLITGGLRDLNVTGTCLEYGMVNGCLSEQMLTDPKNPYAIAKDTLRKFIEQLCSHHKFNFKWIRLFYIYGKGKQAKSLYTEMEKCFANNEKEFRMSAGEQIRDFLSIDEVAKNVVKISLQNSVNGVINCSSGKPISVRRFVEEYFEKKGAKVKLILNYYPYPDYEPFAFWGDNNKMNSITGLI